jgi:hypothetical protein
MGTNKKWEEGEVQKWRINALPIGDALDNQSPLLELQEVITFDKGNVRLIAEVRLEGFVPTDNPPMINVLTRAQNSLGCVPINVDGEVLLKCFDLNQDFFFQLH